MRTFDALTKLLVVGVPVALLAGCDLNTGPEVPPPGGTASIDLESPYGGYTMADEQVAFADPEIRNLEAIESALQPVVVDGDTVPDDSTFVVRVVWGQLRGNRNAQTEIDWTGSVGLNRGGLALLRTIAFEYPRDHVVRPRPNEQTLEFVSHTLPHYDGLLMLVHERPGDGPTTISFTTAPYSGTWSVRDLVNANLVIPIDDLGNAVSINALSARPHDCPNGFARGGWAEREGQPGIMRGLWLAPGGTVLGHLRGHFGTNEAGENVWFAKILAGDGRVLGLARGRWQPNSDPGTPGGGFAGRFETRRGTGSIEGRYMPGREGENAATGFFEARWRMDCNAPPPPR